MPDLLIAVDTEADGPIPGPYSMSSIGMCAAALYIGGGHRPGKEVPREGTLRPLTPEASTFYCELRPISDQWEPAAAAVAGLDRATLISNGRDPAEAIPELVNWIDSISADFEARPVFVAQPLGFDWMWAYWYMMRFAGRSPFGHSGHLDLKTLYARKADVPVGLATKRFMPKSVRSRRRHRHHALADAQELADYICNIWAWDPHQVG